MTRVSIQVSHWGRFQQQQADHDAALDLAHEPQTRRNYLLDHGFVRWLEIKEVLVPTKNSIVLETFRPSCLARGRQPVRRCEG